MFRFRFSFRSASALRVLWLAYWVGMAAAMHAPVPGRMHLPVAGGDKILHCLMYFLLTMLGARVLMLRGGLTNRRLAMWGAVYLAYAALDEFTQPLTGRTASVNDWLADATGIVLASSILSTQTARSDNTEGS